MPFPRVSVSTLMEQLLLWIIFLVSDFASVSAQKGYKTDNFFKIRLHNERDFLQELLLPATAISEHQRAANTVFYHTVKVG